MEAKYDELRTQFRGDVDRIQAGPNSNRTINDICCYVTFVVIVLATFGVGIYVMSNQSEALRGIVKDIQTDKSNSVIGTVFTNYPGVIAVCFLFAVLIGIGYLVMVRFFPKCMVYTLIGLIFLILIALLVVGIVARSPGLIVVMIIAILIFALLIWCFRQQLELGIQLLQIAARFLGEKPTVYFSTVWVFFLSIIFFIWWMVSVVAIQCKANQNEIAQQSTDSTNAMFAYFIFVYIFMTIFFYYVLSFLISTACSLWFYGVPGNYWCLGTGNINKYHIGSLTFGALILTILKIIKMIVRGARSKSDNMCAICVLACLECILQRIEYIIEVMNSTAVVVMSVTGDSYIKSAQTAAFIIFQNIGLFSVVSVISNLLMFGGLVLAVGIPTFAAVIYSRNNYSGISSDQQDSIGLIVFFGSIIIVLFLISTLSEALNCVFVFFCLEKKLNECGCVIGAPAIIRDFHGYQDGHIQSAQQMDHRGPI